MAKSLNQASDFDVWRQIPPEEKLQLMSYSHAAGLKASLLTVLMAVTSTVALSQPWLLWIALLATPIIFHLTSFREWRHLKPAIMLRYLAARSAARRYAFIAKSQDLNLQCLFRGNLRRVHDEKHVEKALEAISGGIKETEVWIALFGDVVIMLSERRGGAQLAFAHKINQYLKVETDDPEGEAYRDKELILSYPDRKDIPQKYSLTSPYPAALVVFEKRLKGYKKAAEARLTGSSAAALAAPRPTGRSGGLFDD